MKKKNNKVDVDAMKQAKTDMYFHISLFIIIYFIFKKFGKFQPIFFGNTSILCYLI